MKLNIRLAMPADAPDMAEIHARSWEAAYQGFMPLSYIQEKNAGRPALWERILAQENTTRYVIALDGKAVGLLDVGSPQHKTDEEALYELRGLYLHPDYYRQGIGTQAMAFALDVARAQGKSSIILWVFAENAASIKFYESCGFRADGGEMEYQCGKPLTAIRMRRAL